ncbi:hypothetical protein [Acidipropionibacterium timonense]|uniref:hypothetical protein n=1 Tax=Acidipropionibacterium timonense TaxID=2161818 RepID=UPI001FDA13A9|nr:hypothetical protein [Acidipropionibacterium timonense]
MIGVYVALASTVASGPIPAHRATRASWSGRSGAFLPAYIWSANSSGVGIVQP